MESEEDSSAGQEPSIWRLFVVLGGGVGIVTLAVVASHSSQILGLAVALVALVALAGVVLHEVNRLLVDEGPSS